MRSANRPELSYRPPGDGDRQLLATLGAAQDLTDVIAELFLGDRRHTAMVAVLLPTEQIPGADGQLAGRSGGEQSEPKRSASRQRAAVFLVAAGQGPTP
jgi:hypothetical protein